MAWDCDTFERRLAAYEAGTLSESDRRLAEIHLRDCEACRFLVAAMGVWSNEFSGARPDLSRRILAKTSGPTCRQATSLLCGFVDDELGPLDRELVAGHLENCGPCSQLCAALVEMKTALPQLAEIAPDRAFAPAVMEMTRRLKSRRPGLLGRMLEFLAAQAQRPRFSFEAAYLATLLLIVVFGTPISPARKAGPELLAALQGERGLIAVAGDRVFSWSESSSRALATVQAVSNRVVTTATAYEKALSNLYEGAARNIREARNLVALSVESAGNEAKAVYNKVRAHDEAGR